MEPTVAITGATSGIGRAVAEAFVDEGRSSPSPDATATRLIRQSRR